MHNLHVLQPTLTEPRHKYRLHLKKKINTCRRTRYVLQKLAKKGNILLEQTAQALIRLRRYLGMQSQLTMRAICSFFLDVAQQKHR